MTNLNVQSKSSANILDTASIDVDNDVEYISHELKTHTKKIMHKQRFVTFRNHVFLLLQKVFTVAHIGFLTLPSALTAAVASTGY